MPKRTATPADFELLFSQLGELAGLLTHPDDLKLNQILDIFTKIMATLDAFAPPPILQAAQRMHAAMPQNAAPTARDWAGFFQALASFVQVLIPLIQGFITK